MSLVVSFPRPSSDKTLLYKTKRVIYYIVFVGPLAETPRDNKYIITATDYFSKWPEAATLCDKTAVGVADFLFSLFCRHGWPEKIISDQGREFVNAVSRYSSTTHTCSCMM